MPRPIKIDFVSDVSCPWCAIAFGGLEQALETLGDLVAAEIRFRAFELNPDMAPGGENFVEHMGRKFGATAAQTLERRAAIAERAATVGFVMNADENSRVYNTFDAHRLLHWAAEHGRQRGLKRALFEAYFTHGRDVGDAEVLASAAASVGLDAAEARAALASERYAASVDEDRGFWRRAGVSSVPAIIIDDRYLISGGQTADYFERALRQVAAEPA